MVNGQQQQQQQQAEGGRVSNGRDTPAMMSLPKRQQAYKAVGGGVREVMDGSDLLTALAGGEVSHALALLIYY